MSNAKRILEVSIADYTKEDALGNLEYYMKATKFDNI